VFWTNPALPAAALGALVAGEILKRCALRQTASKKGPAQRSAAWALDQFTRKPGWVIASRFAYEC
jgi:hypothetical protein